MVATVTALNANASLLEEVRAKVSANLLEKVDESVALRRKLSDLEKSIVKKSVQQELVN